MPHYLFTNDNRTSKFPQRLVDSAKNQREGRTFDFSISEEKSEGNVTATNSFYFNLKPGSDTLKLAESNPKNCIRNFVIKFQFPNPREKREYYLEIKDKLHLAPYRIIVHLLTQMSFFHNDVAPTLSQDEILYYVFCNEDIYQNKSFDYENIIIKILNDRKNNKKYDLSSLYWKQNERQLGELMKFLSMACSAFTYNNRFLSFTKSQLKEEDGDYHFLSEILNYNVFWECPNNLPYNLVLDSYSKYMDLDKDWKTDILIVDNNPDRIYSDEELTKAITESYDPNNKMLVPHLLGIRYGKTLENLEGGRKKIFDIVSKTGVFGDSESDVNNFIDRLATGTNIYDAIKAGKMGLRFYDNSIVADTYKILSNYNMHVQIITYGAPGTGKSYSITNEVGVDENGRMREDNNIRITFHPDTDYATFVGCYKPMQDEEDKKLIVYKYQPEAFIKSYLKAWKIMLSDNPENFYLIIEEINRGNCAQIFGDMFQLLDRNDDGYSSYKVSTDMDLQRYLKEELDKEEYSGMPKDLKSGEWMQLPPNFCILATMNTSDQSLFPMDSAFKRRWEWRYVPIKTSKVEDVLVDVSGTKYRWADFLFNINNFIQQQTGSTAKQLGPWFAKADEKADPDEKNNTIISFENFRSKVLFFLFNDALRDYDDFGQLFDENRSTPFLFENLFEGSDEGANNVKHFMESLHVQPYQPNANNTVADNGNNQAVDNSEKNENE